MNQKLLVLASLIALAACRPEPADRAGDAEAITATEPAALEPAVAETDPSSPMPSGAAPPFDLKGFAGTFSGTLPCSDCPGIDTTLTLSADGSFALVESSQETLKGSWTAEAGDRHVRLDPDSKSEPDRVFTITSNDRLSPLASDGQALVDGPEFALVRDDAQ